MENNLEIFQKGLIRVPILPVNVWNRLFLKKITSSNSLKEVCENPYFLNGLFIASRSLFEDFVKNGITDKNKQSLIKYIIRSSTRCTPFGLFAGCNTFSFFEKTLLKISDNKNFSAKFDLDFNSKLKVYLSLLNDKDFLENTDLILNNTCYLFSEKEYRYISYYFDNMELNFEVTNFKPNDILNWIINKMKYNIIPFCSLKDQIINDFNYPPIAIESYLLNLIKEKLIIPKPFFSLLSDNFYNLLNSKLQKEFNVIKRVKIGNWSADKLINFEKELCQQYDSGIKIDYVATISPKFKSSKISNEVKNLTYKAINLLASFNNKGTVSQELEDLKKKYYERYGDREVSILRILDNQTGIDFLNINNRIDNKSILNKLTKRKSLGEEKIKIASSEEIIKLKKVVFNNLNSRIIKLDEFDFKGCKDISHRLPTSFYLFGNLINDNNNLKLKIIFLGGSSALKLVSRFISSNKNIDNLIESQLENEGDFDGQKAKAEVFFFSDSKTNNILNDREKIRKKILPIFGSPNIEESEIFNLDKLKISLKNNKFVLKHHDIEVKPCFTTAFNTKIHKLPIIRFLSLIEEQEKITSLNFPNHIFPDEFVFSPRIEYQNIILKEATWKFSKEDFDYILNENSKVRKKYHLNEFIKKNRIDNKVLFVEGDNEILLNLENNDCLELFLDLIKKSKKIHLKEFISCDGVVFDEDNQIFNNQIVLLINNRNGN